MRRCWLGGGMLVLLLILGLLCGRWTVGFFTEAAADIRQAAQLEPEQAREAICRVQDRWQRRRGIHGALFDHAPMEEIDTLFALAAQEDDFRENCIRLSRLLEQLADSQRLTLENLL